MHQRIAHPPVSPDSATSGPASIIDSLSDTLLNAFTKVRKPDERFLEVRDNLDKFEESLVAIERTEARARTRIGGKILSLPPSKRVPQQQSVLTHFVFNRPRK